jgi:hypothetical protein
MGKKQTNSSSIEEDSFICFAQPEAFSDNEDREVF